MAWPVVSPPRLHRTILGARALEWTETEARGHLSADWRHGFVWWCLLRLASSSATGVMGAVPVEVATAAGNVKSFAVTVRILLALINRLFPGTYRGGNSARFIGTGAILRAMTPFCAGGVSASLARQLLSVTGKRRLIRKRDCHNGVLIVPLAQYARIARIMHPYSTPEECLAAFDQGDPLDEVQANPLWHDEMRRPDRDDIDVARIVDAAGLEWDSSVQPMFGVPWSTELVAVWSEALFLAGLRDCAIPCHSHSIYQLSHDAILDADLLAEAYLIPPERQRTMPRKHHDTRHERMLKVRDRLLRQNLLPPARRGGRARFDPYRDMMHELEHYVAHQLGLSMRDRGMSVHRPLNVILTELLNASAYKEWNDPIEYDEEKEDARSFSTSSTS